MNSTKSATRAVLGRIKTSYPRLQRFLVPLDFSGKSRQALRYAVPLAQKFGAKIHLVHVLQPGGKAELADSPRLRREAIKRLSRVSAQLLLPRLQTENAVMTGNPSRQILKLAAQNNIDLIVLTTKGRVGIRRALVGSTAEYIMRHATCPVMSIRRR